MQADPSAKQLVTERVKKATNILVTVSRNPSVDALSAALALTLMLNKLDKHATAVFSGQVPSALEFLKPEKTFESTVDSLRDFIISLDKEKADRLRYKVENDVVRIFITPYRTVLSESDLNFSQGDFNVDLIIALGVEKREDLDAAITAHGRILHDAAVVTINADGEKNTLGAVDWSDEKASSLSEMLMSLSEALQSGILDEQIATALLTGIVAATERFRNPKTSPKVMTMAAQLMAAGANQQLIAAKLEEGHELQSDAAPDGSTRLQEGASEKVKRDETEEPNAPEAPAAHDGEMTISHESPAAPAPAGEVVPPTAPQTPPAEEATQPPVPVTPPQPKTEPSEAQTTELASAEQELAESLKSAPVPAAATISVDDLKKDIQHATDELTSAAEQPLIRPDEHKEPLPEDDGPTFQATFNATTDAAAEEKRRDEETNRRHALLSHSSQDGSQAVMNATSAPEEEQSSVDPFAGPINQTASPVQPPSAAPSGPTLAELEARAHQAAQPEVAHKTGVEDARAAVDAAIQGSFDPAHNPVQSLNAQPMEYIETPTPQQEGPAPAATPDTLGGLPPLPDFSTLPPLPGAATGPDSTQTDIPSAPHLPGEPTPPAPSPAASNDPTQFKIPGQS